MTTRGISLLVIGKDDVNKVSPREYHTKPYPFSSSLDLELELASMASVLALFAGIHRVPSKSRFPNTSGARRRSVNLRILSPISAALSGSSWEREEERWLREEQRWLREERRWLREEARWNSEREALLKEIAALTIRIQALEHQRPRSMVEPAPRAVLVEETEVKELVLEEDVSVPQVEMKKKIALRRGSEGDDVREMQVCVKSML